ncbi:MAG: c-type cytochrome [Chloroflexota bacterium]
MIKKLLILLSVVVVLGGGLLIFTYDLIKIDWISFMEIQPSFKPMENPLPVALNSIPVEGAAFIPGMGAPANPVSPDEISLARGEQLFNINCVVCHGQSGKGDGVVAAFFQFKPADLTTEIVQSNSDGAIFMTISNGVNGRMPALNENLNVRDRWDVVNYVRTLK